MARTKEEIAAYNREYRQQNHDRLAALKDAWYAANREEQIERANQRARARKERLADDYTLARRMERNMRIARRAGCTDDEAWEIVMLAEYERETHGETALRGGGFQRLIAQHLELRGVFAALDARQWEPVRGDVVAIEDDGCEEWEEAS